MHTANAPGGNARTFLTHMFGSGLDDTGRDTEEETQRCSASIPAVTPYPFRKSDRFPDQSACRRNDRVACLPRP